MLKLIGEKQTFRSPSGGEALTGYRAGEGAAESLHVRSPGSPELGTAAPISRPAGH